MSISKYCFAMKEKFSKTFQPAYNGKRNVNSVICFAYSAIRVLMIVPFGHIFGTWKKTIYYLKLEALERSVPRDFVRNSMNCRPIKLNMIVKLLPFVYGLTS